MPRPRLTEEEREENRRQKVAQRRRQRQQDEEIEAEQQMRRRTTQDWDRASVVESWLTTTRVHDVTICNDYHTYSGAQFSLTDTVESGGPDYYPPIHL